MTKKSVTNKEIEEALQRSQEVCNWNYEELEDDFTMITDCGEYFEDFGGSLDYTKFKICPFCLSKINIIQIL